MRELLSACQKFDLGKPPPEQGQGKGKGHKGHKGKTFHGKGAARARAGHASNGNTMNTMNTMTHDAIEQARQEKAKAEGTFVEQNKLMMAWPLSQRGIIDAQGEGLIRRIVSVLVMGGISHFSLLTLC